MTSGDSSCLSRGNEQDEDYEYHHRICPTCGGDALDGRRRLYTSQGVYYATYLTLDCFNCGPKAKMRKLDDV